MKYIFAFNLCRYFSVSLFELKHKLKFLKISFATGKTNDHFLYDFNVILAFKIARGILNLLALVIKFGRFLSQLKKLPLASTF